MRYLRSVTQNAICDEDLKRIAMEMVNTFHRTEYWDPVTATKISNPKENQYFTHTRGNMDYDLYLPRGYIYINMQHAHNLWSLGSSARQIVKQLAEMFKLYNEWPTPQYYYCYTDIDNRKISPVHFLLNEERVPNNINGVVVTDAEPGNTRALRVGLSLMTWHLTSNRNTLKYTVPGNYPPEHVLLMAPTMIVLDTSWTTMVDHGFRSLEYPPVPKHIEVHIDPPIAMNGQIGILAHLYNRVVEPGSKHHPNKFGYLDIPPVYNYTGEHRSIRVTYQVAEKLMRPVREKSCKPTECSVCRFPLFQHWYLLEKVENPEKKDKAQRQACAVCVVCAHFNKDVNQQIKTIKPDIFAVQHPVSTLDYITTLGLPNLEETILVQLYKGIQSKGVKSYDESDPLIKSLNFCYNKEALRCGNLLGIENSLDIADAINDAHLLPAGTILFKFELW